MITNKLKKEFIRLTTENNILRFGTFTLKSGRISPYFFNAGLFNNGRLLAKLGQHYAHLLQQHVQPPYMLYGPAYKGIPLVAATACQLHHLYHQSVDYAFNRKEIKTHGEGGQIIGAALKGNIVIVDDVITAGTSISESINIICTSGATPIAVVIAVDRQESTVEDGISAVEAVSKQHSIPVYSIITFDDLVVYLSVECVEHDYTEAMKSYRLRYGC